MTRELLWEAVWYAYREGKLVTPHPYVYEQELQREVLRNEDDSAIISTSDSDSED